MVSCEKTIVKSVLNSVSQKKNSLKVFSEKIANISITNSCDETKIFKNIRTLESISFILSIKYTTVNTFLQLSNCDGNLKISYSAGHFFKGKQKTARIVTLKKFFYQLFLKFPELQKTAVSLQLVNVSNKVWVIRYLKKKLYIVSIRVLNLFPHNGCRNKKIRRKKYKKKLRLK